MYLNVKCPTTKFSDRRETLEQQHDPLHLLEINSIRFSRFAPLRIAKLSITVDFRSLHWQLKECSKERSLITICASKKQSKRNRSKTRNSKGITSLNIPSCSRESSKNKKKSN